MNKQSRVDLVPFDPKYSTSTLAFVNNPEIMVLINRVLPVTVVEHEEWYRSIIFKKDFLIYAILGGDKREHIGNCGLKDIDDRSRKAELWVYFGLEFVEKGYGTEVIKLLTGYGFNSLNLNRIYSYCMDYNARAQKAFEKCGFIQEGVFREDVFIGGKYRDTVRMAILKKEYIKGNE